MATKKTPKEKVIYIHPDSDIAYDNLDDYAENYGDGEKVEVYKLVEVKKIQIGKASLV